MIRILAFDDYPGWLDLMSRELSEGGLKEVEYYKDPQAFIYAVDEKTGFAFIDYSINAVDYNGIDLMRQVHDKSPICRVIMMSAMLDVDGLIRCRANGAWQAMDKSKDTFFEDSIYAIKQEMPIVEIEYRLRHG